MKGLIIIFYLVIGLFLSGVIINIAAQDKTESCPTEVEIKNP